MLAEGKVDVPQVGVCLNVGVGGCWGACMGWVGAEYWWCDQSSIGRRYHNQDQNPLTCTYTAHAHRDPRDAHGRTRGLPHQGELRRMVCGVYNT